MLCVTTCLLASNKIFVEMKIPLFLWSVTIFSLLPVEAMQQHACEKGFVPVWFRYSFLLLQLRYYFLGGWRTKLSFSCPVPRSLSLWITFYLKQSVWNHFLFSLHFDRITNLTKTALFLSDNHASHDNHIHSFQRAGQFWEWPLYKT